MTGLKFGRLLVICRGEYPRRPKIAAWFCRCVCGKAVVVPGPSLRRGLTKSCGCLWKDWSYSDRKHGFGRKKARRPEYTAWASMKSRCQCKANKEFPNYGGRGIRVCRQWQKSFAQFFQDMGPRPGPRYSLERVKVNGDYEPGNCRWATRPEQARNKRTNHLITANGRTQVMTDWLREVGLDHKAFYARLRAGWTEEMAVTIPQRPGRRLSEGLKSRNKP